MRRSGKIIDLRRPQSRARQRTARRSGGGRQRYWALMTLAALVLFSMPVATLYQPSDRPGGEVWVSWVDGDSGTMNGRPFRLHGFDAPEGSAERARCALERRRADNARAAARKLTRWKRVEVSRSYGFDKYNRDLVDLKLDGRDVGRTLLAEGHLKRWNFEAGERKPVWCGDRI